MIVIILMMVVIRMIVIILMMVVIQMIVNNLKMTKSLVLDNKSGWC